MTTHEKMPINDAISYFLEYIRVRKGSPKSTIISYSSILRDLVRSTKTSNLNELTGSAIERYCFEISMRRLAPKTVHNKIAVVRSFVRFLYSKNLTDIRPESIDLPRSENPERVFLNTEEQRKLLSAVKSPRDKAILLLFLTSGLRVSELTELKLDDIEDRRIHVRNGKGYKERLSFMNLETKLAIQRYHQVTRHTSMYVFCNKFNEKLSRQYVGGIVSRYAEEAGIRKKITPHVLRRTFATNLLQNGIRIEELQPIMGHASILTTRSYTLLANSYLQSVYDRVSGITIDKTLQVC